MYLLGFPLLLIPFAIYNILAFIFGMTFNETLFRVSMVSGATWPMAAGHLLVAIGVLLLYVEIIKATRMSARAIVDHVLSMILFIAMLLEFILVQRAATDTFFVLLMLSLVDVIGGFTITIRTAQRDLSVEGVDRMGAGG